MAKRKLSQRQRSRVKHHQQARIKREKKSDLPALEELETSELGVEQNGLVIVSHGKQLLIEDNSQQLFRCTARQNIGQIVCGDNVVWQRLGQSDHGVVVARLERHSALVRPTSNQEHKAVAANIDQVFIVAAKQPALQTLLIDRYLVASELAKLQPIIIINKIDLLTSQEMDEIKSLVRVYEQINYPILYISVKTGEGVAELNQWLKDKVSILAGQSGVGKSSTIKHLLPDLNIQIGHLSDASNLGRHTTSVSHFFHLPRGGSLIDSPGVRDFGLWQYNRDEITWGFKEFRPFIGRCKFSNCTHQSEPGCAIKQAVDDGEIDARRVENYQRIIESAKNA